MIRRVVGLLFLLLGVAGIVLSAAGIVELWRYRAVAADKLDHVGARAEKLLVVATDSLREVATLLKHARKDLDDFRDTAETKAPQGTVSSDVQNFLVKTLLNKYAPRLDNADRTLNTALDAAVVINAVLEGVNQIPLARLTDLDTDQLRDLSGELKGVIGSAQKLSDYLKKETGVSSADISASATQMKDALTRAATKLDSLAARAGAAKDRVTELRTEMPDWLTTAAIALTAFLSWFALGQLCLTVRGAAWLFHRQARPA